MNRNATHIAVQVRQPLAASSRACLVDAARAIPGVTRIRTRFQAGHLLLIDYDAARIARAALRSRAHALGYSTVAAG